MSYGFFSEFRRLLDLEEGKPRITTIQALAVAFVCFAMNGLDVVGKRYLSRCVGMAQSLGLFQSLGSIQSPTRRRVYTVTAWAVYGLQG